MCIIWPDLFRQSFIRSSFYSFMYIYLFVYKQNKIMEKRTFKVIIAATGSVASIKIPVLIKSLLKSSDSHQNYKFEVRVLSVD